ncbi:glycosyltransferase family 2 protein [Roseburia inulinivorans]|uniref:glycosyltransferase family 2 protein n=1 Tax=Roseburia inulinivorans TaxID=360807 RepID=UPI00266BC935|nr:glycosyltransferase family 2 protein [Roseburia inulinivorans]
MGREDELISVVVPVYHVETYIERCVESLLQQTYSNLEIILVDDGGDDRCPQICDEYAKKDARIKVIHKKNGGLSDARNAGMRAASGKYLAYIDSDDYIQPDTYEKMIYALKKENADIAVCNYEAVTDQGQSITEKNQKMDIKDRTYSSQEAISNLCGPNYHYWVTAWNRLYKIKIAREISFPVGKIHEDEFTAHLFYDKAEKIVGISEPLYKYVIRENSIMTKKYSVKNLVYVEAVNNRIEYCMEHGLEEVGQAFLRWMSRYLMNVYDKLDIKDKEVRQTYDKYVEMYLKLYHSIKEKHKLDTKTKAATFMLVHTPKLASYISRKILK